MVKDPYAALGISRSASADEIKAAYRKLAKKYHPDLNPGKKEAERRFKEVSEANDILSDPKKKEMYDRFGSAAFEPGFGQAHGAGEPGETEGGPFYYRTTDRGPGGTPFGEDGGEFGGAFGEDILSGLFGQFARGGGRRRGGAGAGAGAAIDIRGEDEHFRMEIDLHDAVRGSEREITLPNGRRLRLKIPPGIDSGARLRFAGIGLPGIGRGPAGDAYVEIDVKPSDVFRRVGDDLEIEVSISLGEAALGGTIRVPTIDGEIELRVPAGVSSGSRLRVRGKGVRRKDGPSGDQIVVLQVAMPSFIDPELRKFLESWQRRHPYNPRSEPKKAA